MVILGINAYHGDASAALVVDGKLVAAAEEERFNRVKHSAGFPTRAIRYCLQSAGIKPSEIDCAALARDPKARLLRKVLYAVRMPRLAFDRLGVLRRFVSVREELASALGVGSEDLKATFHRVEHHKAHLASSFFVSPFDQAALLSVDGLGDFASTMWGVGGGNDFVVRGAVAFPHSLGIYYTALTQYLGFWKYGDEYKVMGLAAYGEPEYSNCFKEIVQLNGDLGFLLGLDYFIHHKAGPDMTWSEGEPVLGRLYGDGLVKRLGPERKPGDPVEPRHQNIAASLQARLEDAIFTILNRLYEQTKLKHLCLAGGVAFNCVANGQIFKRTPFEKVYIQSAAGDAGLAIGAAYYVWHRVLKKPRSFVMGHSYWGPEFGEGEIGGVLASRRGEIEKAGGVVQKIDSDESLCRHAAEQISNGKILGWFQGRMEWGPRALGNRSILVDPRRPEMKEVLNRRIKHREAFRPFAPSILEERVGDYFEQTHPSPFMLMTYKVRPEKRGTIPAPTHVDGTGRLQTVTKGENALYWRLLKEFENITGVPVLLNTSFNDNEPIVCTPQEAVECFLRTEMDVLSIGKHLVQKVKFVKNSVGEK